jgi:hypothetical protein
MKDNTTNKKVIKAKFKNKTVFYNTITEDVGDFSINNITNINTPMNDITIDGVLLNEFNFYRCFLYLKTGLAKTSYNQKLKRDVALTPINIDYMALIMAKPLSFSMPIKSKNGVQSSLAKELKKTAKSAYSAINRLKNAGYLILTEDFIIVPNEEMQALRKITKAHLEKNGHFPLSYVMNFIITN